MFKFKHALLLSATAASMVAYGPASATEWQITSAYQELFYNGVTSHTNIADYPGKPFVDGQFPQDGAPIELVPWADAAVFGFSGGSFPYGAPNSVWVMGFSAADLVIGSSWSGHWSPPHIDLTNMTADFSSLWEGTLVLVGSQRGGFDYHSSGRWAEFSDGSGIGPITANGDGSYTFESLSDRLHLVINFKSVPDGSAANYVPVPEASTVFMALAGLGALGLMVRPRQQA